MIQTQKEIESLTSAFQDFTETVIKFEKTYESLQNKIDQLNEQIEIKNIELERKYAEGENIKNFLNNILENIYDGVVVVDTNGIITNFNRAAETITGFNKEEMLGKNYIFFSDDTKVESRSALYTLSTRKESYHRQKTIITADNKEKDLEFSTTLLKDHENNILGVVETFNDISEIKSLREKIMHIETLAALGEMSASVAHEIRNPLAGITGFAGLLDRQILDDDPKKPLVKSIIQGTTKLNDIISNLLKLTRPQQLNISEINIYNFLSDLIDYFNTSFININDKKTITITIAPTDKNTMIYCDAQLFQQVVLNILKNAYDAISDLGNIRITTKTYIFEPKQSILDRKEKDDLIRLFSYIEIAIKDDGCGINEDILQKVFNPFFTTKDEGNGLGLAICKKIIQLHKGDINIKSQEGYGTTFTLTLPLYKNI